MRNGQLKPGYNVQIGVECEYIVGIGLFANPRDTTTLIPFLERIRKNTGKKYLNIIADAGYASEEIYTYLEENEQNATSNRQTMKNERQRNTEIISTVSRISAMMKSMTVSLVLTAKS